MGIGKAPSIGERQHDKVISVRKKNNLYFHLDLSKKNKICHTNILAKLGH